MCWYLGTYYYVLCISVLYFVFLVTNIILDSERSDERINFIMMCVFLIIIIILFFMSVSKFWSRSALVFKLSPVSDRKVLWGVKSKKFPIVFKSVKKSNRKTGIFMQNQF